MGRTRAIWLGLALGVSVAAAGCLDSSGVTCSDGLLCPAGFRCLPAGGCAREEQFAACEGAGLDDGAACALDGLGAGVCQDGACIIAVCGNGRREAAEACDDGNLLDGDGCDSHCLSTEVCGNGYRDPAEGCDDGNLRDADGCQATCQPARCGDAVLDPGETCDDGNLTPGDGCAYDCSSIEACGDGTIDFVRGETCDDGNTRNTDGCGATCQVEAYGWHDDSATAPADRFLPAMAYDGARQRVVMFGGDDYGALLGDTWEWDGARWLRATPLGSPSVRTEATLVYDPTRRRLVLLGGETLGGASNEQWTYDGVTWTRDASAPFRRRGHAAVYDGARQALVVFGGLDETGAERGDTWELVDGTWTMTGAGPSPRTRPGMAYDPVHGRTILFGGSLADQTPLGETWAYGGAGAPTWTQLPGAGVEPRLAPSLAFDPARGAVVLFGGIDGGGTFHDELHVLAADGASWTRVDYDVALPGRYAHGFAVDQARQAFVAFGGAIAGFAIAHDTWTLPLGQAPVAAAGWTLHDGAVAPEARSYSGMATVGDAAVMFGGSTNDARLDETWQLDAAGWKSVDLATAPRARWEFAMATDPTRDVAVVFGGSDQNYGALDDTWEYDGTAWTERATSGPGAGFGHAMAYSTARQRIVLFGGSRYGEPALEYLDETWEWDGATWTQQAPAVRPVARRHAAMADDPVGARVILFGGSIDLAGHVLDDTWAYDAAGSWQLVTSEQAPAPRESPSAVFDPGLGEVVLFGGTVGNTQFADTWALRGATWRRLATAVAPPARYEHMSAYAPGRGRLVLFGGYSNTFGKLGDTWSLGFAPLVAGEACTAADLDYDGDGLAGCADDECWARCTPGCPPGSPAAECVGQPTCGDGACSALEDCRICPDDCALGGPSCPAMCGDAVCDPGEAAATCPGDCSA